MDSWYRTLKSKNETSKKAGPSLVTFNMPDEIAQRLALSCHIYDNLTDESPLNCENDNCEECMKNITKKYDEKFIMCEDREKNIELVEDDNGYVEIISNPSAASVAKNL